jgi:hypothetical protein
MKIEDYSINMQSTVKSETQHTSRIEKFELKHSLSKLEENRYKAHRATEALLNPDFSAYKTDACKKDILNNIIQKIFQTENDFFSPLEKHLTDENLKQSALILETKEQYYKKQTVDFTTQAKVVTPSKEFSLNLEISFHKELYEEYSSKLILGDIDLIDPLVINYDEDINPFDNLSKLKFEFDLNNDGTKELIPLLKNGAGFLAHDKNNNGSIDNGSELFGPQSNDGFKELSAFDSDKNQWIDENDTNFSQLKIWQIDDNGNNNLVSLLELGVGAIYLEDVKSNFQYQNSIAKVDAIQKGNGVFIKEDGSRLGVINSLEMGV